ncbi:alkaline phosphatase family protein [bacterium]|nr:alkaline phosphatase family protein [bacterium]
MSLRYSLLSPALAALFTLATGAAHAAGTLVSGPMLGYQSHREVLIGLETRDAQEVLIDYRIEGRPETAKTVAITTPWVSPAGGQPLKFVLPLLEMGATYTYSVRIDGKTQEFPYPLIFKTTDQWEWRKDPPAFSFLFGSCAYLNDPLYDRPGKPYGNGTDIFRHMAASGADFTVWGGDNLYLREADSSSVSGIWYRYSHDFATPDLQKLFAVMPHYRTWDDHDYGPDNANQSYEFKDVTLAAFKAYSGNPSYGEPDHLGVYGKFVWGDAAFFLMDDRYYRDEDILDQDANPQKSVWGDRQINWLKQSLLYSQAQKNQSFRFIVTGGQVVQTMIKTARSETHELYRREREELIKFIQDNHIGGVIFLTGDVHHTALYRRPLTASQSIYELTSSPFSSGSWAAAESEKASDPCVVAGTIVGTQNYCQIAVNGPKDARALVIKCYDKTNAFQWEQTIPSAALR